MHWTSAIQALSWQCFLKFLSKIQDRKTSGNLVIQTLKLGIQVFLNVFPRVYFNKPSIALVIEFGRCNVTP